MMLQGVRPARVPQAHFRNLSGIQDLRVRQAAHFIEQRIDNPPPLDAIARYVGVGRRQLERAFRLATGLSPMAFQRQLRLELLAAAEQAQQHYPGCAGLRFADAHFARDFRAFWRIPASISAIRGRRRARTRFPWAVWRQSESIGFCLACMPVARRHIRGAPVITLGN